MAFKSVFDSDFKYRTADRTDVRLTFRRIRRERRNASSPVPSKYHPQTEHQCAQMARAPEFLFWL